MRRDSEDGLVVVGSSGYCAAFACVSFEDCLGWAGACKECCFSKLYIRNESRLLPY
jgi:hypothetical protein